VLRAPVGAMFRFELERARRNSSTLLAAALRDRYGRSSVGCVARPSDDEASGFLPLYTILSTN